MNIFTLYGKREIFGTWLFPCHMYMSGIVSLYMRGSLHFRGCEIALCVYHRLSSAGTQWIQTASSSKEPDTPREWKNIVTWLLLTLFILCMCPSYRYCAGCVITRSRKEKEEQNWLSFLSEYKHENVPQPAAAWSIPDLKKHTHRTVIKANG